MNEKIEKLLMDLQDELEEGKPLIVEGRKDKKALKAIGLKGEFHTLSSTSMTELAEKISRRHKEVIILTDLDDFGEKAAKKLKDLFFNESVKANTSFRKRFQRLLGVLEFEDLPTLLSQEKNQ
jgi:5S rRNA maturation endonuclease (ribonuclease M5)